MRSPGGVPSKQGPGLDANFLQNWTPGQEGAKPNLQVTLALMGRGAAEEPPSPSPFQVGRPLAAHLRHCTLQVEKSPSSGWSLLTASLPAASFQREKGADFFFGGGLRGASSDGPHHKSKEGRGRCTQKVLFCDPQMGGKLCIRQGATFQSPPLGAPFCISGDPPL